MHTCDQVKSGIRIQKHNEKTDMNKWYPESNLESVDSQNEINSESEESHNISRSTSDVKFSYHQKYLIFLMVQTKYHVQMHYTNSYNY